MKEKVLALLLCLILFSACGTDSRDEDMESNEPVAVQDTIPTLQGEFIYLADAAVFKGKGFIYGVMIDSLALDLSEKVQPFKKDNFDMVPVVLKARIINNPRQTGYDEVIEIKEVLEAPARKASNE